MINVIYFLIFYVLVFSIISGGGADYLDYYKWSDYFSNYDLNIFEDVKIKERMVYLYHHGITDLEFYLH